MAGMELSGRGERRARNHDLPLVPFIDFMLCLVAFLLVTAVWSRMARLEADAKAPGGVGEQQRSRELHVEMRGPEKFRLSWKEGSTVLASTDVPRQPSRAGEPTRYPALARSISEEWQRHGTHRAASDAALDRAVLHTDNAAPFEDIAAVLDALHEPRREMAAAGRTTKVSAFGVTFAVN
jgi:biopolymer transport protein ExbD